MKQQETWDFFKKCELRSLDFIFHVISSYCSGTKILSLVCWFTCCNFLSLFKNQQQTHLSRQCWLAFFKKKKIPFLLIYSCLLWFYRNPFGFSDATLPSRNITQTAACGQHVFTCAWTTKESRISGAGPAVIQVWVLCQFGSMAGTPDAVPLHPKQILASCLAAAFQPCSTCQGP